MKFTNKLIQADCLAALKHMPNDCVDLVMTSPPYADRRKNTYGGTQADKYIEWFLPRAEQIKRVMKPTGSFVLNIRAHAEGGERHLYVYELVIALKKQLDFMFVDDYIWVKSNAYPGHYPNRCKNQYETCFHFTKEKDIKFFPHSLAEPLKESSVKRFERLSENDKRRTTPATGSGMGRLLTSFLDKKTSLPSNTIYLSTETTDKGHSAVFPVGLPTWFIKLFTERGDVVLDPFVGSGTTCLAAKRLGRAYVGVDNLQDNIKLAQQRISTGK